MVAMARLDPHVCSQSDAEGRGASMWVWTLDELLEMHHNVRLARYNNRQGLATNDILKYIRVSG